jgi:hypothetical protein
VGDAFHAVDDGAGKVVGWVDFIFCAGAVVGGVVAAVDDGIAEGFVFIVDRDLGSDAVFLTLIVKTGATGGLHRE